MIVFNVEGVNQAVAEVIPYLLREGLEVDSRNGKVLVAPEPVVTVYHNPKQHVLFSPTRDANPFFHLMEALWMLNGNYNLDWPMRFNKRFGSYSDDDKIVWGAYGWRWRKFFGHDQLKVIIEELKSNPNSRRCVLSMWNGSETGVLDEDFEDKVDQPEFYLHSDLYAAMHGGKDVPCNTHVYFDARGGKVNMTVCCRSNDAIWGAYGANAVHFAFLLEYVAGAVGLPIGVYRQMSNNFHAYTDIYNREKLEKIAGESVVPYTERTVPLYKSADQDELDEEIANFVTKEEPVYSTTFISMVATPMLEAWKLREEKQFDESLNVLYHMLPCDWKIAAIEWAERRAK